MKDEILKRVSRGWCVLCGRRGRVYYNSKVRQLSTYYSRTGKAGKYRTVHFCHLFGLCVGCLVERFVRHYEFVPFEKILKQVYRRARNNRNLAKIVEKHEKNRSGRCPC